MSEAILLERTRRFLEEPLLGEQDLDTQANLRNCEESCVSRPDDVWQEAQDALTRVWLAQTLEEPEHTDRTLSFRLTIRPDLFVQVFAGELTGSLYMALIEGKPRIFGLDRVAWHVHPDNAPHTHAPLPDGLGPKPLLEFLARVRVAAATRFAVIAVAASPAYLRKKPRGEFQDSGWASKLESAQQRLYVSPRSPPMRPRHPLTLTRPRLTRPGRRPLPHRRCAVPPVAT